MEGVKEGWKKKKKQARTKKFAVKDGWTMVRSEHVNPGFEIRSKYKSETA